MAFAVHAVDPGGRPDDPGFYEPAPPRRRQGHRYLCPLRPARGDLLRASHLDRPLPHLLFREGSRRGVLGPAARPVQLRAAARHRRQSHRQDGGSVALRRACARSLAGVARAAALPHPAARRPPGADALSGADAALHLLPDRHQHRLVRRRHSAERDLVSPDRDRRPLPRLPDLELRHSRHRADGLEGAHHPARRSRAARRPLGYDGSRGFVRMDRSFSHVGPVLPEIALAFLLIFWAGVMLVTEGAIKLYDGGAGGFVAVDGGRWVVRTLFWNTQAVWFAALAVLMAVPYLATIYVSVRVPLAELPPDSYTSKW